MAGSIQGARDHLLSRAEQSRAADMDNAALGDMFGIEMDEAAAQKPAAPAKSRKAAPKKARKTASKPAESRKQPGRKPADDTEKICTVICRSKKGIDFAGIQKKTGLPEQKIRNTIAALHRKNRIQRIARGVYKGP